MGTATNMLEIGHEAGAKAKGARGARAARTAIVNLPLRVRSSVRRQIDIAAHAAGKSRNRFLADAVMRALTGDPAARADIPGSATRDPRIQLTLRVDRDTLQAIAALATGRGIPRSEAAVMALLRGLEDYAGREALAPSKTDQVITLLERLNALMTKVALYVLAGARLIAYVAAKGDPQNHDEDALLNQALDLAEHDLDSLESGVPQEQV